MNSVVARQTPERESVARVLLVAFGVALLCSLIVSSAVYWLRPMQTAYLSLARNQAILVAAGVFGHEAAPSERDIVAQSVRIEARLADLQTDSWTDADLMAAGYDYRQAMDDPAATVPIAAVDDIAGLRVRPREMPVYLLRAGTRIDRIVVPVYGSGMWSTIHGFVGLESDATTIAGATFYEHGETPGIGDRITGADWLALWTGKRAFDADGAVALRVGTDIGSASPQAHVDSITGATVTVTAVDRFVRYWLGPDGFGPILATLRREATE